MKQKITLLLLLLIALRPNITNASNILDDIQIKGRLGYHIGATTPLGIPATIRSLDSYKLTPSFMVGFDLAKTIDGKWGIMTSLRLENKAMDVDVTTKGYHMELRKGSDLIEGLFTGHISQVVKEWMFTLPIMGTYQVGSNVQLKAGPYFSLLVNKKFDGIASDGYLRQGTPVGPKITMGSQEGEWATYDFSEDMRTFHMGVAAGVDWQVYKQIGVSADLNWGLTGIFKSSFKTVEQTLYPIYGTIGVFYKIK